MIEFPRLKQENLENFNKKRRGHAPRYDVILTMPAETNENAEFRVSALLPKAELPLRADVEEHISDKDFREIQSG